MDNQIDPAVGSWYQHLDDGGLFQVVSVDEDGQLIEFQHFDGDLEEVTLNEWRTWDIEVTDAPEDWTGPVDIERGDLDYSEVRSGASDADSQKSGGAKHCRTTNCPPPVPGRWHLPVSRTRRHGRRAWATAATGPGAISSRT